MKMLRIQQVRSAINCLESHKRTVRALGIRRLNQAVTLPDNPAVRGMIARVHYLVRFEEVSSGKADA